MKKLTRRTFCVLLSGAAQQLSSSKLLQAAELSSDGNMASASHSEGTTKNGAHFPELPLSARPYVLWMWMGDNVSAAGITRDLEAMRDAGIGGATIYGLSDTVIPWPCEIGKSPTPEVIAYTEPWWALVRHAAAEAERLGLELILHNCAGYESSGGTWITPELSMQEVVWSQRKVAGGARFAGQLERAEVDPHPHEPFPQCYIPSEGKMGIPVLEARRTYYRDIAVLALPAAGTAPKNQIIDLSSRMNSEGDLEWDVPAGDWIIYRFGHTTTGAMIQPAQWEAMGLECDKMSREAVAFHFQHVLSEMKKHLGDQLGKGLTTLYCDSYEAGTPTWTPKMREEFKSRRGYELTPWLPVLAGRVVGSDKETAAFKNDFHRTIEDLYRDCYWATPRALAHDAGLKFNAEPYVGPWEIDEVVEFLDTPTVEFWTHKGKYSPASLEPVVKSAHRLGDQLIAAESFTSSPEEARWTAHPAWLKPIGDAAFCAGVNRINVHHFVQQPWDEKYRPGNVMGQWGIHLSRYQTWWKPGKAWLAYLWRCQSLLQRGRFVEASPATSAKVTSADEGLELHSIHRRDGETEIYFVANVAWKAGNAEISLPVVGKQPELWDPVTDTVHKLRQFSQDGETRVKLEFAETQSYFIVFREPLHGGARAADAPPDFPALKLDKELMGAWKVQFDPRWGGRESAEFTELMDWTKHEDAEIRYYSGTATYRKEFDAGAVSVGRRTWLDLGVVNHIAEVRLNGKDLGVLWTAPWRVEITATLRSGKNVLEIEVTNVWANRLIGDEQYPADVKWEPGDPKFKAGYYLKEFPDWFLKNEPRPTKDRLTFTTWNYFEKDAPLVPSGLTGPVRLFIKA